MDFILGLIIGGAIGLIGTALFTYNRITELEYQIWKIKKHG